MCGIFGYVGERADAGMRVLAGLARLSGRDFDAWSVAVAANTHVAVDRVVGTIDGVALALPPSRLGLGQARAATDEDLARPSLHPQLDCASQFSVVYAGEVRHAAQLRVALARSGHRLQSGSDSELIAHLIEDLLERSPPGASQLAWATGAALCKLRGVGSIVVMDVLAGRLAAATSGEPLVLGFGPDGYYVASDASALRSYARDVRTLRGGEMAAIDRQGVRVFEIESGMEIGRAAPAVGWGDRALLGFPVDEVLERGELLRAEAGRC